MLTPHLERKFRSARYTAKLYNSRKFIKLDIQLDIMDTKPINGILAFLCVFNLK